MLRNNTLQRVWFDYYHEYLTVTFCLLFPPSVSMFLSTKLEIFKLKLILRVTSKIFDTIYCRFLLLFKFH